TVAYYLAAVKSFTRWLVKDRRTPDNPLAHLTVDNPQADTRHDRRALNETELAALLAAAKGSANAVRGLTGQDPHIRYAVAVATGFRAGELASLTPESFALDCAPPCAFLGASQAKNRKAAQQPLPADVAAALRGYLANKPAEQVTWPGTWHERAAD